jgi:uncharacterized protein YkwD
MLLMTCGAGGEEAPVVFSLETAAQAPPAAPIVVLPPPTVLVVPIEENAGMPSLQADVAEQAREVDQVNAETLALLNKLRARKGLPPLAPTALDVPDFVATPSE